MAWQRTIPFGYQMRQGKISCEQTEADAVKNIFSMYPAGESLKRIAEIMTERGIRYHQHTKQWNKHMVKRILENDHYLGDEEYPQIIDREDYLAVRLQKADRNTYAHCKPDISCIRTKTVCAACGAVVRRDMKSHGRARWKCGNSDCGNVVAIADDALVNTINAWLEALAKAPYLLEMHNPPAEKMSMEALRLLNELTAAFNRGTESGEYIRTLIFAAAAEKYNVLPDLMPQHGMDELRTRLEAGEAGTEVRHKLMQTAVRTVRIGGAEDITLELINGNIIGRSVETAYERTDDSAATEGYDHPCGPEI